MPLLSQSYTMERHYQIKIHEMASFVVQILLD